VQKEINEYIFTTSVDRMFQNAKFGVFGHAIAALAIAWVLAAKFETSVVLLGIFMHFVLIIRRLVILNAFNKIENKTYLDYEKYFIKYRRCVFFSGLLFGVLPFVVAPLPVQYHFLILAALVGLAAGAIYTLGEIYSLYIVYFLPVIGIAFIWMIFQEGDIYYFSTFLLFILFFYFTTAAYNYSKNFKNILRKEYEAKEHYLEQKQAKEKIIEQNSVLEYRAHHDNLTDLPNRILFKDRLKNAISKARRSEAIIAVCFVDLDNFKVINDSLGHHIGDKVLKQVTTRLLNSMRMHDTIARWGGDEFIIIMEDLQKAENASRLAQKILAVLSEPCEIDGHKLYVTCSIGISIYPKDSNNVDNLIKYADSAMYKAKDEGKNNFKYYSDDMTKRAFERVVMESSIRAAINKKEFVVYYQPQIDAKNNILIGMEALVRWNHPSLGLVAPDKFLPLAEETSSIIEIDKLVMEMAMEQFKKWKDMGLNPGVLSLNLAVKHLEEDSYIDKLKQSMKKHSIDVRYLVLELTESDIMKKPESSIEKLQEINSLGINIAIDDFGTGYSSLAYLKRLPMDELKIDKSFIDDLDDEAETKAIVKAIIAMANTLDLALVAEGVEEEYQKEFLLENGCYNIQGYLYAKPMMADDMTKFIKGMDSEEKS
jgi:diguanylate cyclase (GGDEF)-like protein